MRRIFQSFALFCLSLAAHGTSAVAFSESKHAISAFNKAGQVLLPAARPHLDIVYPRVFAGPDALVDFYMPAGLFVIKSRRQAGSLEAAGSGSIEEIGKGLQRFENGYVYEEKLARAIQSAGAVRCRHSVL